MISAGIAALLFLIASQDASAQPYTDCDIGSYYSSLSQSPLNAARDDMHTLIKDTHRDQLPYSSSSYGDVWDALIAVDSDASGENVRLVYGDVFVPATPYDQGTCEYWNREHLWPRSLGVGSSGKDNTDLHHLRPSDCNVNSARSNLYFGSCGTASSAQCTSPAHPEAALDTEKDSATFLPPANRRGGVARAILYMDLRYDGDETSTTLDLVVSDCPETVPDGAGMGYLSQLLQWHLDDPPDAEEIQRNGEVCTDWQGNRNPFIDYPELASIYHGGPRPLLGDGLGYDCTVPPPPPPPSGPGICSDNNSRSCSSTDQCLCASTPSRRNLRALFPSGLGLDKKKDDDKQKARAMVVNLSKLVITGVIDGPLTGGLPKAIELYALDSIPDLSVYGIGSANNGGGTDGPEFTMAGSAAAGSFITISSESSGFYDYFGESPSFTSAAAGINGDDAIELFFDGAVVDTFGDINVDGTAQPWEYMDGWAYRNAGSTPGGSVFQPSEWTLSGVNAVDGCNANAICGSVFPFKTFVSGVTEQPTVSPTKQPTGSPIACECLGLGSISPTAQPSNAPTNTPTNAPTLTPTRAQVCNCGDFTRKGECKGGCGGGVCSWKRRTCQ